MKSRPYNHLGKWLGAFSAAAGLILWLIIAYTNQFYPDVVSEDTWMKIAVMAGLAVAGIIAAMIEMPFLMILIFLFSFFPAGLYMLGVPSVFRLIGFLDLVFFLSSILIFLQKYKI